MTRLTVPVPQEGDIPRVKPRDSGTNEGMRGLRRKMVDALPVKCGEKRQTERVNEWLPICSIPLLERLVPRVQIYLRLAPLPPFSWSPGHPCESYHGAHASHLSTMSGRFRFSLDSTFLVFKYWHVCAESVHTYFVSFLFLDFLLVFHSTKTSCAIYVCCDSKIIKWKQREQIHRNIILTIKFLRAIICPPSNYIVLTSILLIFTWIAYYN